MTCVTDVHVPPQNKLINLFLFVNANLRNAYNIKLKRETSFSYVSDAIEKKYRTYQDLLNEINRSTLCVSRMKNIAIEMLNSANKNSSSFLEKYLCIL